MAEFHKIVGKGKWEREGNRALRVWFCSFLGGGALVLRGEHGHELGGSRFHFGDETLDAPPKNRVEDERGDSDDKSGGGGDERFGDTACKVDLAGSGEGRASDIIEGFDHPDHGAEEADHGGDGSNVREIGDAGIQEGCLPGAFRFGDLTDFYEAGGGVLRGEIEGFLGDAGDGFVGLGADVEKAGVVAFADERFGGLHEAPGDGGALADGEEVVYDETDRHEREADQRVDHDAALREDVGKIDRAGRGCGSLSRRLDVGVQPLGRTLPTGVQGKQGRWPGGLRNEFAWAVGVSRKRG